MKHTSTKDLVTFSPGAVEAVAGALSATSFDRLGSVKPPKGKKTVVSVTVTLETHIVDKET